MLVIKVFFLNTAGSSWTNLSYDLPNQPVNWIDFNANNIYVGTDIGVFRREVSTTTWTGFSHGIPNQSVPNTVITDIEINWGDGVVYVSIFARGIWISGLYGDCAQAEYLTLANDDSSGNPNTQYIRASRYIESNRLINATNNSVIYQSGGLQLLKPGFRAQTNSFFKAISNKPCTFVDPDS